MPKLQATGGSAAATQPARDNSPQNAPATDQPATEHSHKPVRVEAPVSESVSPATSNQAMSGGSPSEERIQLVAYQLWCDRGCPIGSPELDWLEAERLCQSSEE